MFQALDSLSLQLAAQRRLETLRRSPAGEGTPRLRRRLGRALVGVGSRLAPEDAPASARSMRPAADHT
jgi:hypothetical protein